MLGVLGAYYADPFTIWFSRSIPRTTWPLLYISASRLRAMMGREVCDDKSIARLSLHAADGADPRELCLKRQHLNLPRLAGAVAGAASQAFSFNQAVRLGQRLWRARVALSLR